MKKVAVLAGGCSAEREVSLSSGAGVLKALKDAGYDAFQVDICHDVAPFIDTMRKERPDVVFNALHGMYGEDGCVQGLLDLMQIPYTHSGRLASALAMDKVRAKEMFKSAGLDVPKGRRITKKEILNGELTDGAFVLKPVENGSSVGVHIFKDGATGNPFKNKVFPYGDDESLMIEEYIAGREMTVAVMDTQALGVLEIIPTDNFYDYEHKYADGGARHIVPANIPQKDYDLMMEMALKAHQVLGCRGISRSDFRYDDTVSPARCVILETNTQPGMTPTSLVPDIARYKGLSYQDIVVWMVEHASFDA